jgi:hypothetical protein
MKKSHLFLGAIGMALILPATLSIVWFDPSERQGSHSCPPLSKQVFSA